MGRWDRPLDLDGLTAAERRVVELVVAGATNKAVARTLDVSGKTVEFHLGNVYRKLDVSSRGELSFRVHSELAVPADAVDDAAGNLPTNRHLVGRERELADLVGALAERRLITVTGPGGVGKTTVAIAAAHMVRDRHADGCWFVDLASVAAAQDVAIAAAGALDLLNNRVSMDAADVASILGAQRRLVLLDNCEHVVDSAADLGDHLVRHCPNVTVLTTSRERLDLSDEVVVRLTPFDVTAGSAAGAAAALFRLRAVDVVEGFEPSGAEDVWIDEICRRLDGLPLAIELAAARLTVLSVQEIAESLEVAGNLVARRRRAAHPRQASLDATIRWSYDLLDADQRRLLTALSVLPGQFDRAAAIAIAAALRIADGPAALTAIVERSLAQHSRDGRIRLLDTIRAFAREELSTGDADTAHAAFVDHFVGLVQVADRGVRGPNEAASHAWFVAEWHNLRAVVQTAIESGMAELAAVVVERSLWWALTRYRVEIGAWAERVDEVLAPDHAAHGAMLAARWYSALATADQTAAESVRDQARTWDATALPGAEPWIPCIAGMHGGLTTCLHHAADLQRRAHAAGDLFWETVGALQEGAGVADGIGAGLLDLTEHRHRVDHAVALAARLDNPNGIAFGARVLGSALSRSDPRRARQLLEAVLTDAEPLQLELLIPQALIELGRLELRLGAPRRALSSALRAIQLRHRTGAGADLNHDLAIAGVALEHLGSTEPATTIVSFVMRTSPRLAGWFALPESLDRLQRALSPESFDELRADSAYLDIDGAVALVRAVAHTLVIEAGEVSTQD